MQVYILIIGLVQLALTIAYMKQDERLERIESRL